MEILYLRSYEEAMLRVVKRSSVGKGIAPLEQVQWLRPEGYHSCKAPSPWQCGVLTSCRDPKPRVAKMEKRSPCSIRHGEPGRFCLPGRLVLHLPSERVLPLLAAPGLQLLEKLHCHV